MSTPHRFTSAILVPSLILVLGLALAVDLAGQRRASDPAPGSVKAVHHADQLLRQVEATLLQPEASNRSWRQAAHRLESSVKLRADDDPRAIEHLNLAAALAYGGGDRAHARRLLEEMGRRAQDEGDVMTSADAFARAAWLAAEQKDTAAAQRLKVKALRLARSPLLNGAQRQNIQERFAAQSVVTAQARP